MSPCNPEPVKPNSETPKQSNESIPEPEPPSTSTVWAYKFQGQLNTKKHIPIIEVPIIKLKTRACLQLPAHT